MIGKRLKKVRVIKRLTQVVMAEKLSISQANYNRYENNVVEPNIQFMYSFSNIFSVDLHWLLTGKGEMFLAPDSPGYAGILPAHCPSSSPDALSSSLSEIALLKKEVAELEFENKKLNRELLERFRQLLNYQQLHIKPKPDKS